MDQPTKPENIRKAFIADIFPQDGERAVIAKISTASVDRDGEVLMPQGCVTKNFEANPAVFWNHDYEFPVGKCVSIRREGDSLIAKTVFAERPANHPEGRVWMADTLLSLYQQGVLKGFSIGANYIESRKANEHDKSAYGEKCGRVVSKWELLEYSAVSIPCNQDALAIAVSKGIMSPADAKSMFSFEVPIIEPKAAQPQRKRIVYFTPRAESATEKQLIEMTVQKRRGRLFVS